MPSKIKALLFDLDGVLVDAREWHYEALNRALKLFGFEVSRYQHLTDFDGLPTRTKLQRLSVTDGLPSGLHGVVGQLKQIYTKELIAIKCYPVFHIEYAVAQMKREGFKLAVCTNSIRQTLDLMLERAALSGYFDVKLSNEDVELPKPSPQIYQVAMKKLGVVPEECLIIEDNQYGVLAANAAGAKVFAVSDPDKVTYSNLKQAIENSP